MKGTMYEPELQVIVISKMYRNEKEIRQKRKVIVYCYM